MSHLLLTELAKEAKEGRIPWLEYTVTGGCPSCGPELDVDCSECMHGFDRWSLVAEHVANPKKHRNGCSVPSLVREYLLFIGYQAND